MPLFDDLFVKELTNDFIAFPILITIGFGILLSKIWLVVVFALIVAVGGEFYVSSGNIIIQPLTASLIANVTVGIAVFMIAKLVK